MGNHLYPHSFAIHGTATHSRAMVKRENRAKKQQPVGEWAEERGLSKSWALKMARAGHLKLRRVASPGSKVPRLMIDPMEGDAFLESITTEWEPGA